MKLRWTTLMGIVFATLFCGWFIGATAGSESKSEPALVHVVLFDLKEDAPATAAEDLIRDVHEMLAEIPVITEVHAGKRAPGERAVHVKDFDVAISLHLKSASDVQAYLDHSLHVRFGKKHGGIIERVRVCDFYDE